MKHEKIERSIKASHGGKRNGSGRKKGVPNKITADLKSMILTALSNKGGTKYLERVADENMTAFCTLVGKVLPLTLSGEGGQAAQTITRIELVSGVPRDEPSAIHWETDELGVRLTEASSD